MADAALEQSTIGQRPGWGTNALGQRVSLERLSPGTHAHMGWQGGGYRMSLAGGAGGPHTGPWKVLVTEVDPEWSRAPQSVSSFQNGCVAQSSTAVRKGCF